MPAPQRQIDITPRTKELLADCRTLIERHSSRRRGRKIVYLYYTKADIKVDTDLLRLFSLRRTDLLPTSLIGTVAKVSELRRHIDNLRAIEHYREAIIVVRIWQPEGASAIEWDSALQLDKVGNVELFYGPPLDSRKVPSDQTRPLTTISISTATPQPVIATQAIKIVPQIADKGACGHQAPSKTKVAPAAGGAALALALLGTTGATATTFKESGLVSAFLAVVAGIGVFSTLQYGV